jgi:hypothetical protein
LGLHAVCTLRGKVLACTRQIGFASRHQTDARAFGQKCFGTGQTNAFAAASNEDVFAVEMKVHDGSVKLDSGHIGSPNVKVCIGDIALDDMNGLL